MTGDAADRARDLETLAGAGDAKGASLRLSDIAVMCEAIARGRADGAGGEERAQ